MEARIDAPSLTHPPPASLACRSHPFCRASLLAVLSRLWTPCRPACLQSSVPLDSCLPISWTTSPPFLPFPDSLSPALPSCLFLSRSRDPPACSLWGTFWKLFGAAAMPPPPPPPWSSPGGRKEAYVPEVTVMWGGLQIRLHLQVLAFAHMGQDGGRRSEQTASSPEQH